MNRILSLCAGIISAGIVLTGLPMTSAAHTSPDNIRKTTLEERSMPRTLAKANELFGRHLPSGLRDENLSASKADCASGALRAHENAASATDEPQKSVSDGVQTVYGLLENVKDAPMDIGLNVLGLDGSRQLIWHRAKTDLGPDYDADTYRTGFYRNGDVYMFERSENATYGHEAYSNNLYIYDFTTGNLKETRNLSTSDGDMQMFWSTAYDPSADMVYGYTISYDIETDYQLVKFKPDDMSKVNSICSRTLMNTVMALTWHDGYLYGIQYQGYSFVRVDPGTGAATVISKPFSDRPIRFSWSGFGMTWVDSMDGFVFNHLNSNGSASLDILRLDGSIEKICDLPANEQFAFLFTVDEVSDSPYTPAKAEVLSNTLKGTPDRSGVFSLLMPSRYASGAAIPANAEIRLEARCGIVDGKPDKYVYGPGEKAAVYFELPDDGLYTFEFKVIVEDGFSKSGVMQYVGYDIPETPGNVKLSPDRLTWDAVHNSRNNAYFIPSDVRYRIDIDGVNVEESFNGTTYPVNFSSGELMRHDAKVTATYMGHESDGMYSNGLVDGYPVELDAVFTPTTEQAGLFTIIDANTDSSTWKFVEEGEKGYFRYYLNTYKNADDWLVTPPINIKDKNSLYTFSLEANRQAGFPERFEVMMGRTPDPREWTETLMMHTEVPEHATGDNYYPYHMDFNVEEEGKYWFAIHAISDANMHTLRVRDIKITDTRRSTGGPDAAEEIEVIPAPEGELYADVTMKMPARTISGESINPLEELTASVTSKAGNATVTGHPGETVKVSGIPAEEGFNDFTVIVNNGSLGGKSVTVRRFIGPDIPGAPLNMKYVVDESNHSVTLSWEAPVEGGNGGYIDPSGLTYTLCYLVEDGAEVFWQTAENIGNRLDVRISYDESEPFIDDIGVVARNDKGLGKEVAQAHFSVGRPWKLPMRETFANFYSAYYPYMILGDTPEYRQSNWGFADPSKAGPQYASTTGYALVGEGYEDGSKGMFAFPKFSTMNVEKVSVSFYIYLGSITPVVNVYAEGPGELGRAMIGTLTSDCTAEGWRKVELELPDVYCGHGWVSLILDAEFKTNDQKVLIDSFSFKEAVEDDLAVVSVSGPATPELGRTNAYTAVVDNLGTRQQPLPAGRFVVKSDGKEIAFADIEASDCIIEPDKVAKYLFHYTPNADMLGKAVVEFRIIDEDARPDNNVMTKDIEVSHGANVVVTDLDGEYIDGAVRLSWTEPVLDDGCEGFEDCEPFLVNDNAAWLGNFKNIDRDGQVTFGTSGWDNPNAGGPAAFSVWNLDLVDAMLADAGISARTYSAAEGKQLAIAFSCGSGYSTDDWLISPEIVSGSKVSLMLRPISTAYQETVELLFSADTDDPESFEGNLLKRFTTRAYENGETIEYERLETVLPDNARYFAIHYISKDKFAVMIDEIHYSPAKTAEGITGYEILRDDKPAGINEPADGCRFNDADVERGSIYQYRVVPLLGRYGSGLESNTAVVKVAAAGSDSISETKTTVTVNGNNIFVEGCAGQRIDITDAQGRIVASVDAALDNESFQLDNGVYILKTGIHAYKIILK